MSAKRSPLSSQKSGLGLVTAEASSNVRRIIGSSFGVWHLVSGRSIYNNQYNGVCLLYLQLGKEDVEQLCRVTGRIGKMDDRTSIESLAGDKGGEREHVGKHGRLFRYNTAVDTEGCSLRNEDGISVFESDLRVALESGGRGCQT